MNYIEREKALKVVADIMSDCKVSHKHRALNRNIKQIPTADVVEVVRCKDCKYFTKEMIADDLEYICNFFGGMITISPDYYCSYSERREG